jgi:Family of unknown function (DUF5990)
VRIQIVGTELPRRDCGPGGNFPGYANIHDGVQCKNRRDDLLDLHPGDASTAVWTLDYSMSGTDVRGPYISGAAGRTVHLFELGAPSTGVAAFRRAKLMLEDVPNTHDRKRHQRVSLRQALVAETLVEPWLRGWRWDAICSHSKLGCSGGCRPVTRPWRSVQGWSGQPLARLTLPRRRSAGLPA